MMDVMYTSMFDSSSLIDAIDCTSSRYLLLDAGALLHSIPHREWFCTYSTERHIVHLDGIAYDVEGVGDVHLLFASGALILLRHVRQVPSMAQCLISIPQLQDLSCKTSVARRGISLYTFGAFLEIA